MVKKGVQNSFFKGLRAEAKRISWPSKNDFMKALRAVIVFCIIYIAVVTLLDGIFKNLFNLIMG